MQRVAVIWGAGQRLHVGDERPTFQCFEGRGNADLARRTRQAARVDRTDGRVKIEDRQLDHKAITVKELCIRYLADLQAGLILGKGGRPKKASTIVTDTGSIERHIIPLIGTGRVKDLARTDINKALKDIMAGKARVSMKTKKLRGKAIVRGGAGTATRTVGLLGGILTYAVEAGIIETNPAHGIRKPKDNVRKRRLSEAEYRILGRILRDAAKQEKYATIVDAVTSKSVMMRMEEIDRPSTELGAVRRNVDRIEGRRSANEQAVELGAAESHVRDYFWNEDFADQRAVEVIAMDPLCSARPNAAIPIDTKTVE